MGMQWLTQNKFEGNKNQDKNKDRTVRFGKPDKRPDKQTWDTHTRWPNLGFSVTQTGQSAWRDQTNGRIVRSVLAAGPSLELRNQPMNPPKNDQIQTKTQSNSTKICTEDLESIPK